MAKSVPPAGIGGLLFERARAFSSRDALSLTGRLVTYDELSSRALRIAAALLERGIELETVGVIGQRNLSSYLGVAGILYAGCSYVPINPKYSPARLLSILRDAKVRAVVGTREDVEQLRQTLGESDLPPFLVSVVPDGQGPTATGWLDEAGLERVTPLVHPVQVTDRDRAYLLYTSGSTGVPKGVEVAHGNVLAFLRNMSESYPLDPGFRASQSFDFSFDPSVSDMLFTWTMGGTLCVVPEEERLLPHEFIRRERITFWNSVPAIASFMNRMGHLTPGGFPELSHSMFCGEQFPQSLADAWSRAAPNSTVENLYGPTEATIYISRYVYVEADRRKSFTNGIVPIGVPFAGHDFAVVDESGRRIDDHEIGELVFSGPQVTSGYFNAPAATNAAFVSFPWDAENARWYRSGDLGFRNADGNFECIGRRDNQIKLGGRRIEIGEIEAVLQRYSATRDIVVVPVRDSNAVVTGCVGFVTRVVEKAEEQAIRQGSTDSLERLFFPKRIIFIESFPLAPSGKVDRKALAAIAQQQVPSEGARPA